MLDGELGVQALDQELGIVGSDVILEEGLMSQQQAKKADQAMVKCEQTPQAQVPLCTAKTRALCSTCCNTRSTFLQTFRKVSIV